MDVGRYPKYAIAVRIQGGSSWCVFSSRVFVLLPALRLPYVAQVVMNSDQ